VERRKYKLMKIKMLMGILILSLLTGCKSVVETARYIHDADKIDNYIYGDAKVANEYIEKIVQALNTNDRELLASLFPEHARSKIDHFDEKIDYIIRENKSWPWPSSIIRYKLNEDNNYQSRSDRGKIYKEVYANTTIEFADPKEGELYRSSLKIAMVIVPVDDFHENNVGISIFAIGEGEFIKDDVDKEKDGYDIYAFGH
jgi:lipoprotein